MAKRQSGNKSRKDLPIPVTNAAFNINDDRKNFPHHKENPTLEIFQRLQDENDSDWKTKYSFISELLNLDLPIIRNTFAAHEPLGNALNFTGEYSALGIPLFFNDHFFGIVVAVHHEIDFYDEETYLFASIYASIIPGVLKNALLITSIHDQAWLSTALSQVAETIQAMISIPDLLATSVNLLTDLAGVNASVIFLYDQSANTFHPQHAFGFSEEQHKLLNDWDVTSGTIPAFDLLLERKIPVIATHDTVTDEIATRIFIDYDLQANLLILFPLIAHENIIGAVLIDFTDSKLGFDSPQKIWDEMYAVIQGITHQSAYALENLQKIKSREEEAYISVALLQVAQAIVSLNQLDDILNTIVRVTPILVGVKRCVIYLWDKENQVFHLENHFGFTRNDLQFEGQLIRLSDFPFLGAIFQQNDILYYQLSENASPTDWGDIQLSDVHIINRDQLDDEQLSIKLETSILREKSRLLIGLPLSVTGDVLGVMLIEEEDPIRGATSPHIRENVSKLLRDYAAGCTGNQE
jgi:transcriptional regulator with GAF, ATPase, and Fis domain